MHRLTTLWALALALTGLLTLAPSIAQGQARKVPAATIAVLDLQQVERDSRVGKDIHRQLQEYARGLQAEVQKTQEQLRREEDELKRQQTVLAPDAFAAKRKQFEDRVGEAQRQVQVRQQALQKVQANATNLVKQELSRIIEGLQKEIGYNLLIDRAFVVYRAEALDITKQVVQRLDQSMPALQVPPPGSQ
jgi:Skp family chaperone for outer membrane proteins